MKARHRAHVNRIYCKDGLRLMPGSERTERNDNVKVSGISAIVSLSNALADANVFLNSGTALSFFVRVARGVTAIGRCRFAASCPTMHLWLRVFAQFVDPVQVVKVVACRCGESMAVTPMAHTKLFCRVIKPYYFRLRASFGRSMLSNRVGNEI